MKSGNLRYYNNNNNGYNQGRNNFMKSFNTARGKRTTHNSLKKGFHLRGTSDDVARSQNLSYRNPNNTSKLEEEKNINQIKNEFANRRKETEDNRKKLITITALLPELKRKYFIALDQKISYREFLNLLRK